MISFIRYRLLVFQSSYTIFIFSPAMFETSTCSTYLSAFDVASLFNFSYSVRCVVVSDFGFNLHFSDDYWVLITFSLAYWSFVYLPLRNISVLHPFKKIIYKASIYNYLYVLKLSPLSVKCFVNIYPSLWLPYINFLKGDFCSMEIFNFIID